METQIRPLQTHAEYFDCVRMQKETWGQDSIEIVPPILMLVLNKIGGLVAGAFDEQAGMVGFVISLPGFFNQKKMNWSKMLAVSSTCRDQGIGRHLKLFQREYLLQQGIDYVYWTYDPLVARNAHLNLNKLGARIHEYAVRIYPDETGSALHRGMELDRFIVEWPLAGGKTKEAVSGGLRPRPEDYETWAVVNTEPGPNNSIIPVEVELVRAEKVRIEIPAEIEQVQAAAGGLATVWRRNTRRAFTHYLNQGYSVETFYRAENRCFYALSRS